MGTMDALVNSIHGRVLQHRLLRNLVLLMMATAGIIAGVLLVGSYRAVDDLSERVIAHASKRAEAELWRFFEPVEAQLEVVRSWGEAGELSLSYEAVEALNQRFLPMLLERSQANALLLTDSGGREYMLLREGAGWLNRYIDEGYAQGRARWIRWDAQGQEVERWEGEHPYQMRERPWYRGAIASEQQEIFWTAPYLFFSAKEPGITASTRFSDPSTGRSRVVAIDILLADISAFTTRVRPTENGFITVLTTSGEVIGLPRRPIYENQAAVKRDILASSSELGLIPLEKVWQRWRESGSVETVLQSKDASLGSYRAGFRHFQLGRQEFVVATVVPREDLTGFIDQQRNIALTVMGFALIATIALSLRTSQRYEERLEEVVDAVQRMGQYLLEEKLGAGGMGEVYRARHGLLQRPTAVKLLRQELYRDEISVQRFEREVRLSCMLRHPNTVTIFDYGQTEEGTFYYAMELIDGVNLNELLSYAGPLSEGRVIYLLLQICGSLAEAHQMGLLHRDIKPGNIMVGNFGGIADRIKVLDFGLVKELHRADQVQLTDRDYIQGSPGYMAPEVILGELAEEPTVDIYAVGAVAYGLLCGAAAYGGDSAVQIMMAQVSEEAPNPSEVLQRQVEPELEALIMRCMERDPDRRPASMKELMRALAECPSARAWSDEDALDWWCEHASAVIPVGPGEKVEGTGAFERTVSMTRQEQPRDLLSSRASAEAESERDVEA